MDLDEMKHELRTPVHVIEAEIEYLIAELCRDVCVEPGMLLGQLQNLLGHLSLLKDIIDDRDDEKWCRIDEEMRPFLKMFEAVLHDMGHDYHVLVENTSFETRVCVSGVMLIAGNLIQNAARYTEPGGMISVYMRTEASNLILKVSDNGCGIPKRLRKEIYDYGFRASVEQMAIARGKGIGLTLVARKLGMMRGKIELEGAEGEGSCFTVAVPVKMRKKGRAEYA